MTKIDKMVADYVNNYWSNIDSYEASSEKEDIAKAYKQGLIDMLTYIQNNLANFIKYSRSNNISVLNHMHKNGNSL